MLMQLLAGLACFVAALLQFAVYREPTIVDTAMRRTGRRIVMAALTMACIFSLHAYYNALTPSPAFLILMLVAMSQSLFAMSDLWPHLEKEHPRWTSRLTSSL